MRILILTDSHIFNLWLSCQNSHTLLVTMLVQHLLVVRILVVGVLL